VIPLPPVFEGPVLGLFGEHSQVSLQKHSLEEHWEALQATFPNIEVAKIPNARHWLHVEAPNAVVQEIRRFIEKNYVLS
jgi:pimeloyl-ACP methyl ester carboxylesterase